MGGSMSRSATEEELQEARRERVRLQEELEKARDDVKWSSDPSSALLGDLHALLTELSAQTSVMVDEFLVREKQMDELRAKDGSSEDDTDKERVQAVLRRLTELQPKVSNMLARTAHTAGMRARNGGEASISASSSKPAVGAATSSAGSGTAATGTAQATGTSTASVDATGNTGGSAAVADETAEGELYSGEDAMPQPEITQSYGFRGVVSRVTHLTLPADMKENSAALVCVSSPDQSFFYASNPTNLGEPSVKKDEEKIDDDTDDKQGEDPAAVTPPADYSPPSADQDQKKELTGGVHGEWLERPGVRVVFEKKPSRVIFTINLTKRPSAESAPAGDNKDAAQAEAKAQVQDGDEAQAPQGGEPSVTAEDTLVKPRTVWHDFTVSAKKKKRQSVIRTGKLQSAQGDSTPYASAVLELSDLLEGSQDGVFRGALQLKTLAGDELVGQLHVVVAARAIPSLNLRWHQGWANNKPRQVADAIRAASANVNMFKLKKDSKGQVGEMTGNRTLLMDACIHRNVPAAHTLLLSGADPNKVSASEEHMTALHFSAIYGYPEVCDMLLTFKAEVNVRDSIQRTPLVYACKVKRVDCLRVLLTETSTDVNAVDSEGMTALMSAAGSGSLNVLNVLLEHHGHPVDLELTNPAGLTALVIATVREKPEIVEQLLEAKANPNHRDNNKLTPLLIASIRNSATCVTELVKAPAVEIDATDDNGRTSLMFAALKGNYRICHTLLKKGADSSLKDERGHDADAMAKYNDYNHIVELLQTYRTAPEEAKELTEEEETALRSEANERKAQSDDDGSDDERIELEVIDVYGPGSSDEEDAYAALPDTISPVAQDPDAMSTTSNGSNGGGGGGGKKKKRKSWKFWNKQ